MKNYAVVLAAGKGTRMVSDLPKVLHNVCGVPMLQHIINQLKSIHINDIIVVVGHKSEEIKQAITQDVIFVEQLEQNGTAHAVSQAIPYLQGKEGTTLVVTGDTPLIESSTLQNLIHQHLCTESHGTVLTAIHADPTGYGRIVRHNNSITNKNHNSSLGDVRAIVEEKDASFSIKEILEVNTGIFAFNNQSLLHSLPLIRNNNKQSEYYLTDIVETFLNQGYSFEGISLENPEESFGINNRAQLAEAEAMMQAKINKMHMDNGVTLINPKNTYIEKKVLIGKDSIIYPGVVLKGNTVIGENVAIHSSSEIQNSHIGDNSIIRQSVIHNSELEENTEICPFAHIKNHKTVDTNIYNRRRD